jgi:hypothetical protein
MNFQVIRKFLDRQYVTAVVFQHFSALLVRFHLLIRAIAHVTLEQASIASCVPRARRPKCHTNKAVCGDD